MSGDIPSSVFIILGILFPHCYYNMLVQLAMQHIPVSANCCLLIGVRVTIVYPQGIFFYNAQRILKSTNTLLPFIINIKILGLNLEKEKNIWHIVLLDLP